MIKNKVPFTPVQIIFTVLSLFVFAACAAADISIIALKRMDGEQANFSTKLNLAFCIAAAVISLFLIFKTGRINSFAKDVPDGDIKAGTVALRTYICMISFDAAVTLCLMPLGLLGFTLAKTVIMIFAPGFFVISAVIYFIRASKIGLEDFGDDDESDENKEE